MKALVMIKLLRFDSEIPQYATSGAACFDLRAVLDAPSITIPAGGRVRVPTGIAVQMLPGYEMQIRPRSGHSSKGLDVVFGTIDSDYRGEVSVLIANNSGDYFTVHNKDRIAQATVVEAPRVEWILTNTLDDTKRGGGGYGSTGGK